MMRASKKPDIGSDIYDYYELKAGIFVAVFIVIFGISFVFSPNEPFLNPTSSNSPNDSKTTLIGTPYSSSTFTDKILFSIIAGTSGAIIFFIIFLVGNTIKTQRLNEKLQAITFKIRHKRSKILSLMEESVFQGSRGSKEPPKKE